MCSFGEAQVFFSLAGGALSMDYTRHLGMANQNGRGSSSYSQKKTGPLLEEMEEKKRKKKNPKRKLESNRFRGGEKKNQKETPQSSK